MLTDFINAGIMIRFATDIVAMTLLIAESRPDEKDVLTRVVVNLINRRNP